MGFYSQDCIAPDCGHPALSEMATKTINAWMSQVVAISPQGDIVTGEYNGYGTVGSAKSAIGWGATVWHKACWEVAGKPTEYQGESKRSYDQGWFFDDGAHDKADPRLATP